MKLDKFMWGIIYAITFALLYMVVFLLFPPNAALHVLQTCRTSVQSFAVNFVAAPVSYFEILNYILGQESLLKHAMSYDEELLLVFLNFIVVELLIFWTFAYFHAERKTHTFNAHKVFWSGTFATYALVAIESLNKCGTGTSIIGASLTSILLVCISSDLFHSELRGAKLSSLILPTLAYVFLGTMFVSYLSRPIIHLSGLALFVLILYAWDKPFKEEFTKLLSSTAKRISVLCQKINHH